MEARLLKRAIVQLISTFALALCAFFAYGEIASYRAQSKAEAACASFPDGMPIEVATATALAIEAEPRLRFISSEHIYVGFRGAFLDRWICAVSIRDGKVLDHEVRLID